MTFYEALIVLTTMRQGPSEPLERFYERFRSNILTLKLAKGKHILCSPEIIEKENDTATPQEILVEEEKVMAIMFLHRSDQAWYRRLVKSF